MTLEEIFEGLFTMNNEIMWCLNGGNGMIILIQSNSDIIQKKYFNQIYWKMSAREGQCCESGT